MSYLHQRLKRVMIRRHSPTPDSRVRAPAQRVLAASVEDGAVYVSSHPGGYKEMSSILADQKRPRKWAQIWGEGGSCGVLANEYSCTQEPK
jgi:hypothetical protein